MRKDFEGTFRNWKLNSLLELMEGAVTVKYGVPGTAQLFDLIDALVPEEKEKKSAIKTRKIKPKKIDTSQHKNGSPLYTSDRNKIQTELLSKGVWT